MTPKIPRLTPCARPAANSAHPVSKPSCTPHAPLSPSRSSAARHPKPNSRECSSPPGSFLFSPTAPARTSSSPTLALSPSPAPSLAKTPSSRCSARRCPSRCHCCISFDISALPRRLHAHHRERGGGGRIWRLKLVLAVDIAEGEIRHDLFDVLEGPDLYIKSQPAEPHDLNSSVHVRSRP